VENFKNILPPPDRVTPNIFHGQVHVQRINHGVKSFYGRQIIQSVDFDRNHFFGGEGTFSVQGAGSRGPEPGSGVPDDDGIHEGGLRGGFADEGFVLGLEKKLVSGLFFAKIPRNIAI
jgi:hypothetical protein